MCNNGPAQFPRGVHYLLVGGELVVDGGRLRPGQPIRSPIAADANALDRASPHGGGSIPAVAGDLSLEHAVNE